jgi:hypothetical protein
VTVVNNRIGYGYEPRQQEGDGSNDGKGVFGQAEQTLTHNREMNRRALHSGTNTRGDSVDGWRAYEAVHPINQETRILGADQSAAKVRVPVAKGWRAWREEIRPARKAFQPPLHCNNASTLVM